jgi:hypothetical protein
MVKFNLTDEKYNIGLLRDPITMPLCSLFTRLKTVKKHVMNFFFQIENKHKCMVVTHGHHKIFYADHNAITGMIMPSLLDSIFRYRKTCFKNAFCVFFLLENGKWKARQKNRHVLK